LEQYLNKYQVESPYAKKASVSNRSFSNSGTAVQAKAISIKE
jgi:hypothetical protein